MTDAKFFAAKLLFGYNDLMNRKKFSIKLSKTTHIKIVVMGHSLGAKIAETLGTNP